MSLARIALAFTVSGLVLAGVSVVTRDRLVTWVAIAFVAVAIVLRYVVRRRAGTGEDRS